MTITWKGSPNFDTNRTPIDRIVIHWFGRGTLEGANATFQKEGGTSAHYGISDNQVWQWVKEEHVAYHAGVYAMNQRSIGIEHDANPDKPLSEASYQTSAELIRDICKRYNIEPNRNNIIKHSEVKATQCPGTIDLDKLINLVKGNMTQVSLDSETFEKLVSNSSRYDEFCKIGYTSAAQVEKEVNDLKSAIADKNLMIEVEEQRADEARKELNDLITACAKALNTVQEVTQIKAALTKTSADLDTLDDLQRQYAEIQLHSKEQVEALNAEIAKWKAIAEQTANLGDYETATLIKEIIRRFVKVINLVK